MSCGTGSPIATETVAAIGACQIIQGLSTPPGEAQLQMQRVINYLVGQAPNYRGEVGGLVYRNATAPYPPWPNLGKGIIPDLERVVAGEEQDLGLRKDLAENALESARAALKEAEQALNGVKGLPPVEATRKLKQSAVNVSNLLQRALRVILE